MEEETTTMTMTMTKRGGKLNQSAMEDITERLSAMENLYFPRSIQETAIYPFQRRSILFNLVSTDTAVFLERYGSLLTSEELCEFDVLKDDYEINWHLNHLRTLLTPTTEEVRFRSVTVKNRRRAYLNKLVSDGKYFSEDAMRDREPYLHHEYVGKFQDPCGRNMRRPGEKWSETLSRRAEEAILVEKIRGEQERLGVDEKDWVGNVREEEEQEEEDDEEEEEEEDEAMNAKDDTHPSEVLVDSDREPTGNGQCTTGMDTHEGTTLCTAEMEDQMEQFTHIMQQKFLSGEDSQHMDYARIDNDETLDDHWFREANHDAEEKYFDDD